MKLTNYIDGSYVPPVDNTWIDSYNPATGRVAHQVADSGPSDISAAVAAARAAFPRWAKTPVAARSKLLNRIADLLDERLDAFAQAESSDQGKPVSLARNVDIPRAASNFRFFAGAVLHHEDASTLMDGGALNYTHRKPVGVAGLISPWNLPLYLLTWKIAPALATGNTVVAKPSEMTSLTAYMLGQVLTDAGLPDGVCNLVLGTGPKAGAALVNHPEVPLISFTGGTQTAVSIARDAAPHFKKLSLELGGKNANIIFADADLETCLDTTIRSSFLNQGEICLCGSRIFVERGLYDTFLEQFLERTRALVVGDPSQPDSNQGALVSAQHRDKVESYIQLAGKEGGRVVVGGDRPSLGKPFDKGYFLNPTVITGLDPSSRVMTEEIFGPVVTVTPFDTEAQVIEYANRPRYGLAATIWTSNLGRGHRVAQAVDAGIIWVNNWMMRDLRTPFGGMKASGIGREGGTHSIDFYTETQNICIKYDLG